MVTPLEVPARGLGGDITGRCSDISDSLDKLHGPEELSQRKSSGHSSSPGDERRGGSDYSFSESTGEHTKLQSHPIDEKQRIVSLDVLRGFAVLGILAMNIQYFSMISVAYWNPTAYGELHGANYLVWLVSHVLTDQKFMTIFSMLFGAGILLMTSRAEVVGTSSARLHYRRMGWLLLFGIAHSYLLWSGDILFTYGMAGLVVYPCRKLSSRILLITGLLIFSVPVVSLTLYGISSEHWSPAQLQAARERLWTSTPEMAAMEIAAYRGGWTEQMRYRVPDSVQMETVVFLAVAFWRVTGLMLIGMALFKLGVFSAGWPRLTYLKLVIIGLFIGIPITLYGTYRDFAAGWDFRYSFFYGVEFNYWASVLVSLGWIGLAMLGCGREALSPVTRRLAAVGRMAFTNYILQTVICTTIFYGHGLGLFGKVQRVQQFAIVVAIWMIQLTVSPIWLRYFLFGPLEWLWRSLNYWTWEPFRRESKMSPIA